jgi:glycosyltransferase involved in cell wall biosynthesis
MLRPFLPRRTRLLVRQNSLPGRRDAGLWTPLLYRSLYRFADAVICQTEAMAEAVARATGSRRNLRVLPNPVDISRVRGGAQNAARRRTGPGPHLLAMGRLAPEKGFDLLLHAVASVQARFPTADLTILGAGDQEQTLRALAKELAIEEAVHFAGYQAEPEAWFAGTSLFVLSSRREGLPNALLEAAAAGLPIVATPALGGLGEWLAGRRGVWLAHTVSSDALAEAILCALDELPPRGHFVHSWVEEFRAERAVPQYEALIDEVLAGGR